jgi:hypothetical protein
MYEKYYNSSAPGSHGFPTMAFDEDPGAALKRDFFAR